MTYASHGYTIEDALARNNDVYEVEFDNWGTRTTVPGTTTPDANLQFPPPGSRPIPSSVAAIAIGPRSLVDRCWVSWDRQKTLTVPLNDGSDFDAVVSSPRIVTCDAPLLFPQATTKDPTLGPKQSWWDAMRFGTAYVFPWGPQPGFNNSAQGRGDVAHGGKFGTTTGYYIGQTFVTLTGQVVPLTPERPFLQLLLYTKLPVFSPPTRRASMLRSELWTIGADPVVKIYPIFGRKHVSASFISHPFISPAQTCDYTLGLIRNVNENSVGSPMFEVKGAEALAVPGNTGVNLQLSNPCADYLVVRVNSANAPTGGAFTIVAED